MRLSTPRRKTMLTIGAAFLCTACIWGLAAVLFGFYPFGEKSILVTDLSSQYVEFHAGLYDMTTRGEGWLFTWNAGMGMNYLGLIAYYLSSPLTLLMFLFPRAMLTEALLFLISLKIALAGMTFSFYLYKRFSIGGVANMLFAAFYALSGYSVVYCFNLMWLDGVWLLPLVLLAARHLFEKQKILPFVGVLTLLFFANFYIAYIVGIFTFLLFVCWLISERSTRHATLTRLGWFFLSAVLAAGLAAVLLLPAFFSLTDHYQKIRGFSLSFQVGLNPIALLGKLSLGAYDSATNSGAPNVYCGILTMGLLPLWFLHKHIKRREKLTIGALLLFLLLSMVMVDMDLAWHMFQIPNWFPYRYSFVAVFVLLVCAARTFSDMSGLSPKAVLVSFGGMIVAVTLFGQLPRAVFAGKWLMTAGLLILYGTLVLFCTMRKTRWLPILLACCVVVELTSNTILLLKGLDNQFRFVKREEYAAYTVRNQKMMALLEEQEDENFYRTENATARDANDGLAAGYHAVSHYSSMSNQYAFRFMGRMGMICYAGDRYFRYMGATSALDALMGVKYVFDTTEERAGMVFTGAKTGDTMLFRNENTLPLVYFSDGELMHLTTQSYRPLDMQDALFSALTGREQDVYLPLDVEVTAKNGMLTENGGTNGISAKDTLIFKIQNPRKQHVLLYLNNNLPEMSPVYVQGNCMNVYRDRLIRGVMELGEQEAGEIEVRVPVGRDSWLNHVSAYACDETALNALFQELKQGAADSLVVDGRLVSGSVTAPRDGVLFTSIPYDKGWRAQVDGENVKIQVVDNAFMALPVAQGSHTFTLHFVPHGLVTGGILSLLSLVILAGIIFFRRRV